MLPTKGSHPEMNVLYIGGFILKKLNERKRKKSMTITQVMKVGTKELSVSVDHIIIALDWLYIISAISYDSNEVFINEVT